MMRRGSLNATTSRPWPWPTSRKILSMWPWEIMLLSEIGPKRYSSEIDKLIAKANDYENAEGGWPYQFDKKGKPADFISYNIVLALAEAGRRPETDAHMALAVKA